MRKNLILTVFLGLNLLSLMNCATSRLGSGDYGYLRTSVKFPDKKFTLKVIPDSTLVILVKVSGTGLDNPLSFDLTKDETTHIINNVPQGDKTVKITALNVDGQTVAEGENSVNIIPQLLNTVEVTLNEVQVVQATQTPGPTPTGTPTPLSNVVPGSSGTPLPTVVTSGVPSSQPSVVPSGVTAGPECNIIISPADLPLSQSLQAAIIKAGCVITLPSPVPTATNFVQSGSGGGSGTDSVTASVPLNVNVADGSPVPAGIGFETPGP